jgi:hypothetical protein
MGKAARLVGVALVVIGATRSLGAAEPESPLPPADRAPHLVLAHPGPHAPVTALAFAPNSTTLYVAGFDKQIRRYDLVKGKFVAAGAIRVPIGPGVAGVVNTLAVSPDGKWVAAAGRAPLRDEWWADTEDGIAVDARHLAPLLRRDAGVVYLFDPANPEGARVIRGPECEVRALAFATPAPASGPVLVTAGIERNTAGELVGAVRAFTVADGKEFAARTDLPATDIPPGLAACSTGPKRDGLRVAVAWDANDRKDGELLVWDAPGTPSARAEWLQDGRNNAALAVRFNREGAVSQIITGAFHTSKGAGGLMIRAPDGAVKDLIPLPGRSDEFVLPIGLAALDGKSGPATAVLARILVTAENIPVRFRHELRFVSAGGVRITELDGIAATGKRVLAASPDARFVAVAGFTDNRVEVYETTSLAAGKPEVQKLAGGAGGFTRVAFLVGEKLWLGTSADTPEKGGVILDLDRNKRVATARGAKDEVKVDAPTSVEPKIYEPDPAKKLPWRVTVTVDGVERTVALPAGERATAAAFHPGRAGGALPGPVLAVARVLERTQSVLVTLYDPVTGNARIRLGGPTLPVRSLAFSGTRALLAGAGDDGTVAVWALKNVMRPLPAVEGLVVVERGGAVVVASIEPGSPAAGKFRVDDVIESVEDARGAPKTIKQTSDFHATVRSLKIGDSARIRVTGRAPVAVVIGTATGYRHPLFTLWVDPVAKDGRHDWVGWTSPGPYDANSEAAEARIGWLTATGIPARPVTFAPAEQYRKLYYKHDFIRLLLDRADYRAAFQALPQPERPSLEATLAHDTELIDGLSYVRTRPESLTVTLHDPDSVLDLDRVELRWQISGPGGTSAWATVRFKGARVNLDLVKYPWKRGEHRVHIKLVKTGDAPADEVIADEINVPINYLPRAPGLVVMLDGQVPPPGEEQKTQNEEVEVTATVDAKANPDGASATVSWTGGGDPVELRRNADGTFAPLKVKLKADTPTTILVTATNRGEGVNARAESRSIEARVRRLPPKVVPPPGIQLRVDTPHDFRSSADKPYVVSTEEATVTATISGTQVAEFGWEIDGVQEKGGALDPKTRSLSRIIKLQPDKSVAVRAWAKAKDSAVAGDTVVIRSEPLPEVVLSIPPVLVTAPDLVLSGGLKAVSTRPFRLRALITSTRTGSTREVEVTQDPMRTRWEAGVTLFPGENQIGYAIRYDEDRKTLRRSGFVEVRYASQPVVVGAAPVDVGTGTVGAVALAVVSSPDLPPTQLWVNDGRAEFRTPTKPLHLFGAAIWPVWSAGVAVPPGADRLKPVGVVVRNAELDGPRVSVAVLGRAEVKVVPPTIRLAHKGGAIAPDQLVPPVSAAQFPFDLEVTSETRLTKVEVWHAPGAAVDGKLVPGVKLVDAVAAPGGFVLTARPELRLRPGPENHVRVVAANETGSAEVSFLVSYTPPAVRVVVDAIAEPGGAPMPLLTGTEESVAVASPLVEVSGRVLWDFDNDPLARDDQLEVVFAANGVAHLPVRVSKPVRPGVRERKFVGRVYLNVLDPDPMVRGATKVRIQLRSGGRAVAVPQDAISQAKFSVVSSAPLLKQRLHLLVVGVRVPPDQQQALIANVIRAVGGTVPGNGASFLSGRFERKGFEFAALYSQLGYTSKSAVNGLLNRVRQDIEDRAKRPGEEWVNDVIVVYYQGTDWVDDQGRWYLHSALTLSGAAGKNAGDYAIRLDALPEVPGIPVAVVNVAGRDVPRDNLLVTVPYLRTAWAEPAESIHLLQGMASAIRTERTFNGVVTVVGDGLSKAPQKPVSWLMVPREMRDRYVGVPKP